MAAPPPPSSILIVGSGVFGLSTALALSTHASYTHTTITVLDRSVFPSPDGSSIDSSRIVRADYADAAYARLAEEAQEKWREEEEGGRGLGGEGRYTECGLVLVADGGGKKGEGYVERSRENVDRGEGEGEVIKDLKSRDEIKKVVGTGGGSGDWGYVNWRSGWADAEAGMRWLRAKVEDTGRVRFVHGEASSLLRSGRMVHGVKLKDGAVMEAELVVLATGAWTGRLVDLRGRATATGQVLMYLDISAEEQERLGRMPVLLNMTSGMFIIPPRNRILKVARHGYGYWNPVRIEDPNGTGETIEVSVPKTKVDDPTQTVPREGQEACRKALREMIPELGERPFSHGRICWYTDTPKGDFLITYHPDFEGLFLATGGSGHGYKFLPVIGSKIVNCIGGKCPVEFKNKWAWPKDRVQTVVTEDGARGGQPGYILEEELRKDRQEA